VLSSKNNNDDTLTTMNHYGYFIPFEKSLENLLNVSKNLCSATSLRAPGFLKKDIFDGTYINEKISLLYDKNLFLLCFSIYSDDVEFANGIGPNRGKNKLSI
jgi:hypothetical protein